MVLTAELVVEYVTTGGVNCPYCQSEDLEARNQNFIDEGIYFDCSCLSCLREWKEHYTLVNIVPTEETIDCVLN